MGAIMDTPGELLMLRFQVASWLNQSGTFDTTGYVLAEALGGEFWTADRRFVHAARFVP